MPITLNTTSLFNGQGFNVQDLVNQILTSERGQETQWKNQQTTLQNQTTALKQIQSQLSALEADSQNLTDFTGVLGSVTASSSDPGVLYATATSAASTASHVLQVQSLASAGTAYSDPLTDGTTLDPATLSITVGDNTQTVDVGTTNTSLSQVAAAINKLGMGVTANVQTDASGSRLTVVSNSSGSAGSVSVSSSTSQLSFTNHAGQNALVYVDGVPYQNTTNTIAGAINGVTLHLASADPNTDITLSVSPDVSSVASAISTFVTDYNSLVSSISSQFSYNSSTSSAGVLSGDSSLRMLQSTLLGFAAYSMADNNGITTLADLGITMGNDGTFTLNSNTLTNALTSNFQAVQNFLQVGSGGFGDSISSSMTALSDPANGPLALDLNSISQTNQDLTNQVNAFEANLTTQEQFLVNEYSGVNAQLQELPLLQDQVSAELGSLNPYASLSSSSSSKSS